MYQPRRLRVTASIILCFVLQALGADKYTDENRPYEFGFKIDGQQHRHESKDKDGIIMGEFGFITADDVYHVTVYATDKEGRFKILSMKNIHLKSSPDSSLVTSTSARQGHALALPPAQAASVQASVPQGAPVPQPAKPSKSISIQPPARSCSSCSLPTTTTRAPPPIYIQETDNNNYNSPNQFGAPGSSPQTQQASLPSSPGQQNNAQGVLSGTSYAPQGGQQNYPSVQQNYPQKELVAPAVVLAAQPGQTAQNYPGSPSYSQGPVAPAGAQTLAPQPVQTAQNYPSSPSYSQGPSAPNDYAQQEKGVLPSAGQNQGAGQQPGLPQTNLGGQNSLSGGRPYAGSGPSGSDSSVPSAGNLGQVNSQQPGISGFNAQPAGQSSYPQRGTGERTSKQYVDPQQQFDSKLGPNGPLGPGSAPSGQRGSVKPTLVSAQMQIVDKNTDIYALGPGEQKGLPPGLTTDDMTQLLYTFNYTVGFHGHFEEGYTNGVKKGYYYVTGRNGVRTRIDYIADDLGFHPKVSQEVLDLLSEDVPKPETEKDEKYGLKGYEFKWLYYPVDSKRR